MSGDINTMSDEALWDLAHEVAGTGSKNFDVSAVPEILGVTLTVEMVQGIIDNGGIEYLLGPDLPRGLEYSHCPRAFKLIDAFLCAEALERVYSAFPQGSPPVSQEERAEALDRILESKSALIDAASRTFWEKSASNYTAALRLLRAHPEVLDAKA